MTIKLTEQDIARCQTANGGFTKQTLAAFGVAWPPVNGWKRNLIGTEISEERYREALAGGPLVRKST